MWGWEAGLVRSQASIVPYRACHVLVTWGRQGGRCGVEAGTVGEGLGMGWAGAPERPTQPTLRPSPANLSTPTWRRDERRRDGQPLAVSPRQATQGEAPWQAGNT